MNKFSKWIKKQLYLFLKNDMIEKLSEKHGEQFIDDVMETFGMPTNLLESKMNTNFIATEVIDHNNTEYVGDSILNVDLIPLNDFIQECINSDINFNDNLGYAIYSNGIELVDVKLLPSDAANGIYESSYPYVVWFEYIK